MAERIAVVTGGSRGIGAAAAAQLAADGCRVVVHYHSHRAEAEALATRLGGVALGGDCASAADMNALAAEVHRRFGRTDVLVCSAGIALTGLFQCLEDAAVARLYAVNLGGTRNAVRAFLPDMIARQMGAIVTVSSIWGQVGASCEVDYSATKAGIIGLTQALAKEVAPSGIRVNCVAPGVIDTEMNGNLDADARAALCEEIPLGRFGTPDEVGAAIRFLASSDASYITGQVLGVGGGFS